MSYSSEVLADSPLAYWRLGDASGTTMTDSSGNSRNGTYTGSPTLGATSLVQTDQTNNAVTFDGVDDRGESAWASWHNVSSLSIECWFKTTSSLNQMFVARDNTGTNRVFQFNLNVNGKVAFTRINDSTGAVNSLALIATGTAVLRDGNAHHAVVTYDGSTSQTTIYVDGVQVAQSSTITGGLWQPTSSMVLSVGARTSASSINYFVGTLDEVAYYGTVLSAARVAAHYAAGVPQVDANATGTGTATATVVPVIPRTAAATGIGTATAVRVPVGVITAGASGTGTATAAVVEVEVTTAAASGTGTATATVVPVIPRTAAATGTGTATATVVPVGVVAAAASGTGIATATSRPVGVVVAAATGTGTATATVVPVVSVVADATGTGTATATVVPVVAVTANATGIGTATATAAKVATNYTEEVLLDSPLAYWRQGEASGTTMVDSSGNSRDGFYGTPPILGTAGLLTGDPDTAATYQGPGFGSFGQIAWAAWQNVSELTLECWVETTTHSAIASLIDRDAGALGVGRSWQFRVETSGQVSFIRIDNAAGSTVVVSVTSAASVTDGLPHHIALTYDGTTIRMYIDGVADGTASAPDGLYQSPSTAPLSVGCNVYGGSRYAYYAGVLDEVAYYGTALSAARIAAHYTMGSAGPPVVPEVTANATGSGTASASVVPVFARTAAATGTGTATAVVVVAGAVVGNATGTGTASAVVVAVAVVTAAATGSGTATANAYDATILTVFVTAEASGYGEATATVVVIFTSDSTSRTGGRWRKGIGYATWTPALELPPIVLGPGGVDLTPRISALSFSNPTVDDTNGRVAYDAQRVEKTDYIDRLIVGSKDVTYWREIHTPAPSFILVEPLGYGPATITFPQVAASFEKPGVGVLWFLRLGASVKIQRVNRLTGEIIATDYKGLIISHDTSGSTLVCQVGGEATGRAAMQEVQVPIFTWKKDLGRMAHDAIRILSLRFDPYLGPITGIRLQRFGGTGMLEHLQQIMAMSWNRDGNRWTVMPNEETGAYEMHRKDRTTIHATAYLDDSRTVGSLLRDMTEEPNRIFMTGVTPEGLRVRFGAYPGLKYTEPPPYPFASNATFGQGTTDAETDTGDGISILINRLFIMKYIDRESLLGGYDIDVTRAVRDLQRDAGLSVTGDVNPNTWNVLYDFETTGWSLIGSRILPAAELSEVKMWNRTPSGARLSRNSEYDPSVPPVDRNIDVGVGYERAQMREWAQAELEDSADDNWVGSIEFSTLALIRGEHNPGDALTVGDIMPARDLRPGMNIWLPTFAEGILVHVSTVSVTEGIASVDVDTRARDAMEVWEVMARNKESRSSLRRAFIQEHFSSTETKDSTTPWDEVGGILGDKVPVPADTWTVFPIIAGQAGTIASLRVNTNPNAEYVMAVFGKHISSKRLHRSIGNPLTRVGSKKWNKESVRASLDRRFIMLYVAGSDEEPLGYFPKTKTGEDDDGGGNAPLTGRWEDDAGFPYRCFNAPVLWVAVYADRATVIPEGRMMWPQLESGT